MTFIDYEANRRIEKEAYVITPMAPHIILPKLPNCSLGLRESKN